MGAFSQWEEEYEKEAYYREKIKEDVRQWQAERLSLREDLREDEECNRDNPCGHCVRCCQDEQGYDPS